LKYAAYSIICVDTHTEPSVRNNSEKHSEVMVQNSRRPHALPKILRRARTSEASIFCPFLMFLRALYACTYSLNLKTNSRNPRLQPNPIAPLRLLSVRSAMASDLLQRGQVEGPARILLGETREKQNGGDRCKCGEDASAQHRAAFCGHNLCCLATTSAACVLAACRCAQWIDRLECCLCCFRRWVLMQRSSRCCYGPPVTAY